MLDSQKFSAFVFDTEGHAALSTGDDELMWTLLDYSAWSNLGPDDIIPPLSPDQPVNVWPDLNMSLDEFCTPYPGFDFEGLPVPTGTIPPQPSKIRHYT